MRDSLSKAEIEKHKKVLAARKNSKPQPKPKDLSEGIHGEKEMKSDTTIITEKGLKKIKSTGDFVGDSFMQHARDQKQVRAAIRKRNSLKYVKPNFFVNQANLSAQWVFPVGRLEEFLSLFNQAVYDVVVNRMSVHQPIDQIPGERHTKDARIFAAAFDEAIRGINEYGSSPDKHEVDYYFWIIRGKVYFGCVLPGSEQIKGLEYRTWKENGKKFESGIKWVGTPQIVSNGEMDSLSCPDGVFPSYVRLLSFKPGQMVGIQELARRMVRDHKERTWAIQWVLRNRSDKLRKDRKALLKYRHEEAKKYVGGVEIIADERLRQVIEEGFTAEHDDSYVKRELVRAAMTYAAPGVNSKSGLMISMWPASWDDKLWKPSDDVVDNLRKAGALIAAEIDRVLRERRRHTSPG